MSRFVRLLMLAPLVAAVWGTTPRGAGAVAADDGIFRRAAIGLGHDSVPAITRWLRAQAAVSAARFGPDGRTLTIHFADGRRAVILPPVQSVLRLPLAPHQGRECRAAPAKPVSRRLRERAGRPAADCSALPPYTKAAPATVSGVEAVSGAPNHGRAAAFEPFATELGLSPGGFDPAVSYLEQAGFQVDTAYDDQVTLSTMATMARYNVVYVLSHSGVEDDGTGVLATAEQTACKPYTSPDGTVQAVGIWGSSTCYLAITPKFIENLPDHFPADSVAFLNGCTLLISHPFWVALANQGAGVMMSWNGDALNQDDVVTAQDVFGELQGGLSVAQAVDAVRVLGAGRSVYQGKVATFGYVGDGTITLRRAAAAVPPAVPPTLIPTDTPVPTKTPVPAPAPPAATATPTLEASPTATAEAIPSVGVPAAPSVSVPATASPGQRVEVVAQELAAGTLAQMTVSYPSGSTVQQTLNADPSGTARFSYLQQAAEITRASRTAKVMVRTSDESPALSASYTIGFAPVDVYIQQRHPSQGSTIAIWTHSKGKGSVRLRIRSGGRTLETVRMPGGHWSRLLYRLPRGVRAGQTVLVAARVATGAGLELARARVQVR